MRGDVVSLVVLLALSGGCDNSSTVEVRSSCLDPCRGTLTDPEISVHLDASSGLQASFSDVVTAGGAYSAAASSMSGLVLAMVKGTAAVPAGFVHEGSGVFAAATSKDLRLEMRFYLVEATSYGKVGDVIAFNVFDPASYFQGLKVTSKIGVDPSGVNASVEFAFTKAGPGVELLGLGAATASPLTVDVSKLTTKLANLKSAATMISTKTTGTTVHFEARTSPTALPALAGSQPLELQAFTGARGDIGQTLVLDTATLALVNGGGALDGTALVKGVSAKFSFQMLFSFPTSALPDITFGCPSATLKPPT